MSILSRAQALLTQQDATLHSFDEFGMSSTNGPLTKIIKIALLASALFSASVLAEPVESSPLLIELSTYDAIFVSNVSKFLSNNNGHAEIIRVDKPVYNPIDDAFINSVGLDDAAKVHLNNIAKKAVSFGYELHLEAHDDDTHFRPH